MREKKEEENTSYFLSCKNLDLNIYVCDKKAEKGLFRSRKKPMTMVCTEGSRK